MRLKKHYVTAALSLLVYFSGQICLQASPPPAFKEGRATLDLDSQYFTSKSNYGKDGNSFSLFSGNQITDWTSTVNATYFFMPEFALRAGFDYTQVKSEGTYENRTTSNITNIHVGAMSSIYLGAIRLVPDLQAHFSLDNVDLNTITPISNEAITSDGINTYQAGSWGVVNFNYMKLYGYAGFQYRADGYSNLIPWTFGLSSRFWRIKGDAELTGYRTISDDKITDTPEELNRLFAIDTVNAGSYRYLSVNPTLTEARFHLSFVCTPYLNLGISYGQSISGERTAKGKSFGLQLSYNFDHLAFISPSSDAGGGFNPALEEDYDESLFEK